MPGLVTAAREAFVVGLHTAAWASAALMLAAAAATMLVLRSRAGSEMPCGSAVEAS